MDRLPARPRATPVRVVVTGIGGAATGVGTVTANAPWRMGRGLDRHRWIGS
jgi:hypothetical protein